MPILWIQKSNVRSQMTKVFSLLTLVFISIAAYATEPRNIIHLWKGTSVDFHKAVANLLDQRICSSYHLYPNNYIAHDILYGNKKYSVMYSSEEKDAFMHRMNKLQKYEVECDMDKLYEIFLGIYANPVDSKVKCQKSDDESL